MDFIWAWVHLSLCLIPCSSLYDNYRADVDEYDFYKPDEPERGGELALQPRVAEKDKPTPLDIFFTKKYDAYWHTRDDPIQLYALTLGGYLYIQATQENINLFIVRVLHDDAILPGIWNQKTAECLFVPEITSSPIQCHKSHKRPFEFLHHNDWHLWVPRSNGHITNGAILGGNQKNFRNVYICRFFGKNPATKDSGTIVGYLDPGFGECVAPWDKYVLSSPTYAVLHDARFSNKTF